MASVFFVALLATAAVHDSVALVLRQSITPLETSQIDAFTPYTHFSGAAYCPPSTIMSWTCGNHCVNNPGFKPVAAGGDGDTVQYWYVGYEPSLETVIVSHQGTNVSQIFALLTDANVAMSSLDPLLFPGMSPYILVHDGFQVEHAKTASDILSSVQTTMSMFGTNSITLVGHSLGAALSILDAIFLSFHLPAETTFSTIVYGLSRAGNQAFANYVDDNLQLTHINNLKDPIPIIPAMLMGYVNPSGEVHIRETGEWAACPGQDNPSTECIVGDVPNAFLGDELNHEGPYNGIEMYCTT